MTQREAKMGDSTRGLYNKFNVERTDGKSEPGQKHHGCEYFLLDLHHDKHAIAALRAYLLSCRKEYPLLADDLSDKVAEMEKRFSVGTVRGGAKR
jgi:hypothetical protein